MDATFENREDALEVKLYGELDHHCTRGLCESIDFKILRHKPPLLILDFGGVSFMDSSGLAVVMGRRKMMQKLDGTVQLCHLNGNTKRIFEMAGIRKYVQIKEDSYESH